MACDPDAARAFGDPARLAGEVAAVEQPRRVRLMSAVLVGAILAFVVPLYGMPDNMLPPAPAAGLPEAVEWKIDWAIATAR